MVRKLFDGIAYRYDLFNRLASLGLDVLWRANLIRAVRHELGRGGVVFDMGTGTADLIFDLLKDEPGNGLKLIGLDLSFPMLSQARLKLQAGDWALIQGSAAQVPVRDGSCDIVMNAFVLRNIKRIMAESLSEMHRILKPGGKIFFLEMYVPENLFLRVMHRSYLKVVLPAIGKILFGRSGSQEYLAQTILNFGRPSDFSERLYNAGFIGVKASTMSGGIAVLHSAAKKI